MSMELDKFMRYGISNIKKFEWADAYRLARPKAMKKNEYQKRFSNCRFGSFESSQSACSNAGIH